MPPQMPSMSHYFIPRSYAPKQGVRRSNKMSMLTRLILAQWPAGELRDGNTAYPVVLPTGEVGRNHIQLVFRRALELGYVQESKTVVGSFVRTEKVCKLPKSAQKRDGVFPVSQDVHACLLWGHPVWAHLNWLESLLGPAHATVAAVRIALAPFGSSGASFGRLRWSVGKWMLHGVHIPRLINLTFGTDMRLICGMLRLSVEDGRIVLLSEDVAKAIVIASTNRDAILADINAVRA